MLFVLHMLGDLRAFYASLVMLDRLCAFCDYGRLYPRCHGNLKVNLLCRNKPNIYIHCLRLLFIIIIKIKSILFHVLNFSLLRHYQIQKHFVVLFKYENYKIKCRNNCAVDFITFGYEF